LNPDPTLLVFGARPRTSRIEQDIVLPCLKRARIIQSVPSAIVELNYRLRDERAKLVELDVGVGDKRHVILGGGDRGQFHHLLSRDERGDAAGSRAAASTVSGLPTIQLYAPVQERRVLLLPQ
jgi:hypothetical protein